MRLGPAAGERRRVHATGPAGDGDRAGGRRRRGGEDKGERGDKAAHGAGFWRDPGRRASPPLPSGGVTDDPLEGLEPGDPGWPAAAGRAAKLLADAGRPAEAERLAATGGEALAIDRLTYARDAALPYQDALALARFEDALAAAPQPPGGTATPAGVLRLYGLTDDGDTAARAALDHASLLLRLGRVEDAAPLLDALGEIVEPGTVLHSRATAQRVIAYLVLEREPDAGHAYAQAAAAVGSAHGWGDRLADHVAIVHDEMTLVGGERDAIELLTHLRDAAAKAGDAAAEELLADLLREREDHSHG